AVPGPDQDLHELQGYKGVLRMTMVKDTIADSHAMTKAAVELSRQARQAGDPNDPANPYSIGYSTRLEALSQAFGLQVDARANAIEAMRLDGAQEDLDMARHEDWMRDNASVQALEQMLDFAAARCGGACPQ